VARVFSKRGSEGVREMFLDLLIKEDLKQGPIEIPAGVQMPAKPSGAATENPFLIEPD
jgi:hypothetical protein